MQHFIEYFSLKLPLSIERKLSKLSYAKTAHNNVPLFPCRTRIDSLPGLAGCQIFTNPTYPFVRSIQQSDSRAYINAVLCCFPLIPWRNVSRASGRKRPAGKDRGPTGAEEETGQKAPMIRSLVLNRLGHSIM